MDYRRARMPGATYFFTVVTESRRPLLVENIERLRNAFRHARAKRPFHIDAIVILPDHLHTLISLPEGDNDYSSRWMIIKRKFSSALPAMPSTRSQASKREKGVWQRRFWEHCIRGEADWKNHMDYIHYNPVKHGNVQRVCDWPYSSFHRCVQKGWYRRDWGDGLDADFLQVDCE